MCINCNGNVSNKMFKINGRGYNSSFDLDDLEIPLCNSCIKKLNLKNIWFENKQDNSGNYLYEDKLEELISKIGFDKVMLTNICSNSIITLQQ